MLKKLLNNWSLKLLALALGIGLWVFVVGQEKGEISVKVPVVFTNIPKDMVVVGDVISELDVRLYGSRNLLARANKGSMSKRVSLAGKKPGLNEFQASDEGLHLPPGIKVHRMTPARFSIRLAKRVSREVPVRPVIKGDPPAGMEVGEVTFKPDKVRLSGAQEDLKDLDWIWTVPIKAEGLKAENKLTVELRMPEGRALILDPPKVEVFLKLKPKEKPQAASEAEKAAKAEAEKGEGTEKEKTK